jgi:hypothetical protein
VTSKRANPAMDATINTLLVLSSGVLSFLVFHSPSAFIGTMCSITWMLSLDLYFRIDSLKRNEETLLQNVEFWRLKAQANDLKK